jgi:predicted enzyme related to lactoylglutathione lyase
MPPRLAPLSAVARSVPTMTASNQANHHTIQYVELGVGGADGVAAAKEFYGGLFGWEFNDYGPEYAGIRDPHGEGEVGGLNGGRPGGRGGILLLLESADVDASHEAVTAAGATIVEPLEPYPGGRRFSFADPAGNWVGIFQQEAAQ